MGSRELLGRGPPRSVCLEAVVWAPVGFVLSAWWGGPDQLWWLGARPVLYVALAVSCGLVVWLGRADQHMVLGCWGCSVGPLRRCPPKAARRRMGPHLAD